MKEEIWKPVYGYEGFYSVSNKGRVKSYYKGGRIMSLAKHNGYICVRLYKERKRPTHQVHRLVLAAFVGPSSLTCNHKNAVKSDNRVENLEYVTQKENVRHASRLGLMKHKNCIRKRIPVRGTSIKDGTVRIFRSFNEAGNAIGEKPSHIFDAVSGRIRTAYGYRWEVVNES